MSVLFLPPLREFRKVQAIGNIRGGAYHQDRRPHRQERLADDQPRRRLSSLSGSKLRISMLPGSGVVGSGCDGGAGASAPACRLCRSPAFLLLLAVVDGTSVLRDAGIGRGRLRQIRSFSALCGFALLSKHESRLLSWQSIRTFQQVKQLGRSRTPTAFVSAERGWCRRGFRTRWPTRVAPAAASWGSRLQ